MTADILSQTRFQAPPGWRFAYFKRGGRTLRYGALIPPGTKRTLILLPGLGEYSEKHFETARYFLDQNMGVVILDWFGQGRSGRFMHANPQKRHGSDFMEDAYDLDHLLGTILHITGEMHMLAHSMGANIALRYIQNCAHRIQTLSLSAPFLGIYHTRHTPDFLLHPLSAALNALAPRLYTSGHGRFNENQRKHFPGNRLTSDPERFALHAAWWDEDPALQSGDVTFGWVYHGLRSCRAIFKDRDTITIPLYVGLAGEERIVDNQAAHRLCAALQARDVPATIEIETFPRANHELLMERDPIRTPFLQKIVKRIENQSR